ncbi:MAG: ABC transporter permease, partial [Rubrivivax sp.]
MERPSPALRIAASARDPAWVGRVFWSGAALVLLWPLAVATEFAPGRLFDAASREASLAFLRGFWPPAYTPDFLALIARETWRTVAIATAGLTLALILAIPATIVSSRMLSIS